MPWDGALIILPPSVAQTEDRLRHILLGWATRHSVQSMVVRAVQAVELPGEEYRVWTMQVYHSHGVLPLAADLSFGVRASVALRVHTGLGLGASFVYRDGLLGERNIAQPGADELETIVGKGLAAFVGPLEGEGWLDSWLAVHESRAKILVARWRGEAPASSSWPTDWAAPDEHDWDRLSEPDVEIEIMQRKLAPVASDLAEGLERLELLQDLHRHDRGLRRMDRSVDLATREAEIDGAAGAITTTADSVLGRGRFDEMKMRAIARATAAEGFDEERGMSALLALL